VLKKSTCALCKEPADAGRIEVLAEPQRCGIDPAALGKAARRGRPRRLRLVDGVLGGLYDQRER
jgi:hypothetical protein